MIEYFRAPEKFQHYKFLFVLFYPCFLYRLCFFYLHIISSTASPFLLVTYLRNLLYCFHLCIFLCLACLYFRLLLCLFPCSWHSVYHHVDSGGCIWKDCALLHLGALHIAVEWGLLRSSFGLRNKRWTCQKLQVIRSESIKPLLTGKTYMLINFCWIKLKLNWTDLTPSAQAQWAQKRFASSCATLVTIPRRPSSRLI